MRWGNEGISWGKDREHFGSESLEVRSIFVNFESERRKLTGKIDSDDEWWMDGWSFGGVQRFNPLSGWCANDNNAMEFGADECVGCSRVREWDSYRQTLGQKVWRVWIALACELCVNISRTFPNANWHSERNAAASQAKQPDTGKFRETQKPWETFHTEICVKDRINKKVEHTKVFLIFTIFFTPDVGWNVSRTITLIPSYLSCCIEWWEL